jgi:hypothetical protein
MMYIAITPNVPDVTWIKNVAVKALRLGAVINCRKSMA